MAKTPNQPPRTDIGWIIKKYELRLLFDCCTAPANTTPISARSPGERMTARLAALSLIVILAFAVKVMSPNGQASGATAIAAAVSGLLATAIAWGLEKGFRRFDTDLRDSIQISFYGALALVLFMYVVVDTLAGNQVGIILNRRLAVSIFAALSSLFCLVLKVAIYDKVRISWLVFFQIVAVMLGSWILTFLIAVVPAAAFSALFQLLRSLSS